MSKYVAISVLPDNCRCQKHPRNILGNKIALLKIDQVQLSNLSNKASYLLFLMPYVITRVANVVADHDDLLTQ